MRNERGKGMVKTCYFAGHSRIYNHKKIYKKLLAVIEELIKHEGVEEFRVGNYGDFDRMSASAIMEIKELYPSVKLILVIPYLTEEIKNNSEYFYNNFDEIRITCVSENTAYSSRIIKCNQQSVDCSQYLICHVMHTWGGAAKTLEYAKRKKLKIINL